MTGAVMGFFTGLLVDTVLVQTLGITSLLYIAIGYWSGRLRELRDPAHGLVPLAAGAAATAVSGIGMTIIQFLLGVDAPVSLLLVQQIFITVLVNTLISLPGLRARAADRPAGAARGSAPPPTPGVHHRRPQPAPEPLAAAGADNSTRPPWPVINPSEPPRRGPRFGVPEEDRPPLSPQLALRAAIIGTVALAMFAIIFFRLWFLQVLSGNQYLAQATTNRVRDIAIAAPRGRDPRCRRLRPGRQHPALAVADLAA